MAGPIDELTRLFSEFPGIGPRQARRLVQYLLGKNPSFRERAAALIKELGEKAALCKSCFRYSEDVIQGACGICRNADRDVKTLMVVEKDADVEAIESSKAYRGMYFVLGGLMPMTERKNAPVLRIKELEARIRKDGIAEVIFALSTTPEGDYTARELISALTSSLPEAGLVLTLLGRGLSAGAEIEYAETETLRHALRNRSPK
jgi:recombination protein RecR